MVRRDARTALGGEPGVIRRGKQLKVFAGLCVYGSLNRLICRESRTSVVMQLVQLFQVSDCRYLQETEIIFASQLAFEWVEAKLHAIDRQRHGIVRSRRCALDGITVMPGRGVLLCNSRKRGIDRRLGKQFELRARKLTCILSRLDGAR